VVGDVLSLFGGSEDQQWGLFLDGAPVVVAESVISFEFKKGSSLSGFPIEEGGFENYNKVKRPFDVRLRFSTGGTIADRQDLLSSIDAIVDSLDLFDAVTPEAIYTSVNPVHYDYRRTAVNGVGLLVVDVFCEQVRVTASSSFTTAQAGGNEAASSTPAAASNATGTGTGTINIRPITSPQSFSAAPQINGGTVQPIAAAPGQFDLSQALP
jgi:hypothetical protein